MVLGDDDGDGVEFPWNQVEGKEEEWWLGECGFELPPEIDWEAVERRKRASNVWLDDPLTPEERKAWDHRHGRKRELMEANPLPFELVYWGSSQYDYSLYALAVPGSLTTFYSPGDVRFDSGDLVEPDPKKVSALIEFVRKFEFKQEGDDWLVSWLVLPCYG